MADIYVRTNQKIYFAGLALAAWKRAEEQPAADSQAQIHANREAVLFHLYGALLSLCHEVGGYYHLSCASASRIEDFLNSELLTAEPSAELIELAEVAGNSDSWVAQLNTAFRALFEPPREPRKAKIDPGLALIQATQLNDSPEPLSRACLEDWRQQLKSLALRFRQGMSEY